ncbi:tetratricopeptide repeat protein [candidate division KSB1 bacterium]|nr:tetratricopeptide repeat protein [candidate division KSB1 bacterium]
MKKIGLNSNIQVGSKTLHVQTSFFQDSRKISSGIFEGGKIIDIKELTLRSDTPPEQYEFEVKQFHEYVLSDLELLFSIADKVNSDGDVPSRKNLGLLFLKKGFYEEAKQQFLLVREKTNEADGCNYELGKACYYSGEYENALEYLKLAVIDFPHYADIQLLLARTYKELLEYKFAVNHLQLAININNNYHEAYFTFAIILLESIIDVPNYARLREPEERVKEALDYLHQALSLSHEYNRLVIESVLELFNDPDKISDVIAGLKRELKKVTDIKKKEIDDSEFYLKFMFAGLDKDSDAIDFYINLMEKSLTLHPEYADLYQSLGKAYLVKAWFYISKASGAFKNALKKNPQFKRAQKTLTLIENDSKGFLNLLKTILE